MNEQEMAKPKFMLASDVRAELCDFIENLDYGELAAMYLAETGEEIVVFDDDEISEEECQ